jgi:2-dehydropantoate 2-reductase
MDGTIAVLGPGGVGGLLAAALAREEGRRVLVLAREDTAARLRDGGIELRSAALGSFTAPVEVATALAEPVDALFVATKATSLEAGLERVPPDALGGAALVPLLNGIEHVALLRRRYPLAQVIGADIRVESTRVAPGVIEHTSPFALVDLAEGPPPVPALAELLRGAGLQVRLHPDETEMLWAKLAFLAPMALATTWAMAPIGTVRRDHRDELVAMVEEAAAAAKAAGAPIEPEKLLALTDAVPEGMKSSMQRDAEAGRALELDAIGGAVLRAAAAGGVPAPVTDRVVRELAERA